MLDYHLLCIFSVISLLWRLPIPHGELRVAGGAKEAQSKQRNYSASHHKHRCHQGPGSSWNIPRAPFNSFSCLTLTALIIDKGVA
ncbi:hypothetical protein DL98DRAFT_222340 [Cadophora sp. DSE1049]|nr:hypothetical protein DL98DRAFT_222340 [Cadophora sp. DSE1049]